MTPDEFTDAVRADNETALSRLGSSKSLYADTEGEMEPDAVRAAAATAHARAAETFEGWADDEPHDGARETWAAAAEAEREHAALAAADLDDHEPGDPPAVQTYLRGLDGTVERAGGFVGWALATGEKVGQTTGFFVGQAEPHTADEFRDVRAAMDERIADGLSVLEAVCDDDADWDAAREAAAAAVGAAYDEYFETLESLGVNPKPVC